MMQDLPPAIAGYFAAQAKDDPQALAECFVPEAVVHDEKREHRGTAAIAAWHIEVMRQTRFTARPLSFEARDGHCIVSVEVSGSFTGSPVTLEHDFTLRDERIAALEIR